MSNILQSIELASIPNAIDASLIAYKSFLCVSSHGQLHQEPSVAWVESDLGYEVLHTNLRQDNLSPTIERIRKHFERRNRNFQWSLGSSSYPRSYGDILLAHGFTHCEDEPGMAVDLCALNEDIPLNSRLTVLPVTNYELLEQWIRVWLFPVPEEIVRRVVLDHTCLRLDFASPLQFYLGLLDGKPVATVCLFYDGSVAALHYVVALPAVRRQGIGGAMTLMAAREARAKGYRVAVLTASPFGVNIYRSLGFREYCTFSTYQWSPA